MQPKSFLAKAKEGKLTAKEIRLFVKNNDINTRDETGKTALHLAAENNHASVVKNLLANDASVELVDNEGNTALHLACRVKNYTVITTLLDHSPSDFNYVLENKDNKTPLMEYEYVPEELPGYLLARALQFDLYRSTRDRLVKHISESLMIIFPKKNMGIEASGKIILCDTLLETTKHLETVDKDRPIKFLARSEFPSSYPSLPLLFSANSQNVKEKLHEEEIKEALSKASLLLHLPFAAYPNNKTKENKWMTLLSAALKEEKTSMPWQETISIYLEKIQDDNEVEEDFKKMMKKFKEENINETPITSSKLTPSGKRCST